MPIAGAVHNGLCFAVRTHFNADAISEANTCIIELRERERENARARGRERGKF